MSNWKIIIQEATTNYCLNPSAETTGNFVAAGGSTVTRVTTYQKYGLYSYRVETAANNEGAEFTLGTLANAIHYVTMRVAGTLPTAWDWSLDDATYNAPTLIEAIDETWSLYGFEFPAAQANASTTLYIDQNGAGAGDFYIDGIQVEAKDDYYTTYCDGSQTDCDWNGAADASTSSRSVLTRAGGRIYDLKDDYSFEIENIIGTGVTDLSLGVDEYALLPGGELNSIKERYRTFVLTGTLLGSSTANLHVLRKALIEALSKDAVPQDARGYQPIRLRYTGAAVQKEIAVHYDQGLEVKIEGNQPISCSEQIAIKFLSDDPNWYEIGNSAVELDSNDSFDPGYIMQLNGETGQWEAMGTGANDTINAIAFGADGLIYVGGTFTTVDGGAAARIASWNPDTSTWAALGVGVNGSVLSLAVGPDGVVYVGGSFTTAGGAAAARIASWTPSTSTWGTLSSGMNGSVYALEFGLDGTLYASGNFTTAGGGAAARVASWDGAAWSALGAGVDDLCRRLAIGKDGTLYAAGDFLNAGGAGANYIASWDGSAWSTLSSGMNSGVDSLAVSGDGTLYIGGDFTTAGGVTTNYVASWNGVTFSPLGDGTNDDVTALGIGKDGTILLGGSFDTAGDRALADRIAAWNGYTFFYNGLNPAGAFTPYTIAVSDKIGINNLYDIYIGSIGDTGNTTYTSGTTSLTNNGGKSFPIIKYYRTGGTSATIHILQSATTGNRILFDYDLLDGETLTIDLTPQTKNVSSDFFGQRFDAILANSDFGDFALLPGENDILTFVDVAGAPTVTAWMQWRTAYTSWD